MSALWVVLGKELVDGLRDRRSLFSALLYPLIGPLLIGLMFSVIAAQAQGSDSFELPVVGAEHAAPLMEHLRAQGMELVPGPEDPEAAVAAGEADMVLVVPADFPERFEAMRPAPVQLVVDGARNDTRTDARRVQVAVASWGAQIGGLRLVARGVSPEVASAVDLQEVDVATPEAFAASVLTFVPMFIAMAAFIGGMQVAIDASAGERERKSLEPLLSTPAPPLAIVAGKWLAACAFGAVGVVLTAICCGVVVARLPLAELGLTLSVGPGTVVGMVVVALPLVPLAVGMQLLLGTFARSYKEAQTYLSMLVFVPMLPGLMMSLQSGGGGSSEGLVRLVPSLGQQLLLTEVIGGASPGTWLPHALGAAAVNLLLGLGFVVVTARLLRRERVIFG